MRKSTHFYSCSCNVALDDGQGRRLSRAELKQRSSRLVNIFIEILALETIYECKMRKIVVHECICTHSFIWFFKLVNFFNFSRTQYSILFFFRYLKKFSNFPIMIIYNIRSTCPEMLMSYFLYMRYEVNMNKIYRKIKTERWFDGDIFKIFKIAQ